MRAFGEVVASSKCRLVLAGGYDSRLAENREYLQELSNLVAEMGLQEQVGNAFIGSQVWRPPVWASAH